jgi:predicted GNAT superfamily acetyltransferase
VAFDPRCRIGEKSPMHEARNEPITPLGVELLGAALELNNAHAQELSLLDAPRLAQLRDWAWLAGAVGELDAFILVFDQASAYDGLNFRWFRARYPRFAYVDRVAVAQHARGRGLARRLYQAVFDKARAERIPLVTCEVNLDPPNPASDAFHAAMGFEPVGSAGLGAKTVRYFAKRL